MAPLYWKTINRLNSIYNSSHPNVHIGGGVAGAGGWGLCPPPPQQKFWGGAEFLTFWCPKTILPMYLTISVTSVSSERTFSALR